MAGLSFAVLGTGTVLGGVVGPRLIDRWGTKRSIVGGFAAQAAATGALLFLGANDSSIVLLLIATFVGGVANLVVIVGFMVTATSGLADGEQGLATGLATMSQQVGITMGIPIMSAIVAIVVNAALCLVASLAVELFLRLPNQPKA
ncbi:MFS transporter [Cryobacterium aureum]|uniref:MFS transporter n=1 Tax=Cryobacterium aureum TaxID=995037 RepID=UPI000CF4AF0F